MSVSSCKGSYLWLCRSTHGLVVVVTALGSQQPSSISPRSRCSHARKRAPPQNWKRKTGQAFPHSLSLIPKGVPIPQLLSDVQIDIRCGRSFLVDLSIRPRPEHTRNPRRSIFTSDTLERTLQQRHPSRSARTSAHPTPQPCILKHQRPGSW